jgi:hypothetical protein
VLVTSLDKCRVLLDGQPNLGSYHEKEDHDLPALVKLRDGRYLKNALSVSELKLINILLAHKY